MAWLQDSFQEHSIVWLLLSSVLGGITGASFKFLFENLLPQHLIQKRDIIAVKRKYSTPILLAADQLRRRLGNMIANIGKIEKEEGWLPSVNPKNYYYLSTIYAVGYFFGWQQILRHKIVYLDFTTTKETKIFEAFMRAIFTGFSAPTLLRDTDDSVPKNSEDKWVVRYELQSIGDSMIVKEDGNSYVMNYASFVKLINESDDIDLKERLHVVGGLFTGLKANDIRFRRVVAIYTILNAFINYVDPRHLRTEKRPDYWHLLEDREAERIEQMLYSASMKKPYQTHKLVARSRGHVGTSVNKSMQRIRK